MTDILKEIIAHKKMEVAGLDVRALRRAAEQSPVPRDFRAAVSLLSAPLGNSAQEAENGMKGSHSRHLPSGEGTRVRLIAELKRASPSRGILASGIDLFETADIYIDNGASAISVVTDEKYFLGELQTLYDLHFVHRAALPLLRKDFLITEPQIYEARANGADAVLLIAAALTDDAQFADLHALALEFGLTPLVEVHNEAETVRALRLRQVRMIGINNRDLATFKVSLATTERLRPMIPANITVVAESGIFTADDVEQLAKAKVDAVLVGEALITASDIAEKVRELSGLKV
jgi:indole-3-glycerol phosphate synthase